METAAQAIDLILEQGEGASDVTVKNLSYAGAEHYIIQCRHLRK